MNAVGPPAWVSQLAKSLLLARRGLHRVEIAEPKAEFPSFDAQPAIHCIRSNGRLQLAIPVCPTFGDFSLYRKFIFFVSELAILQPQFEMEFACYRLLLEPVPLLNGARLFLDAQVRNSHFVIWKNDIGILSQIFQFLVGGIVPQGLWQMPALIGDGPDTFTLADGVDSHGKLW